jgi:hypothetical protein
MLRSLQRQVREGGNGYVMPFPFQAYQKNCAKTRTIEPSVATKTYKGNNSQDTFEHKSKHMGTKNNIFIFTILYVQFAWGICVERVIHIILTVHL